MALPVHIQSLSGAWDLSDASGEHSLPASVPGCVHTDLLAAGMIPDPWYRDQEKEIHWVFLRDWVFHRDFEVAESLLARERIVLRFHGLDTFCMIELNGQPLLEADNMHRTWEVDVKAHLVSGRNHLKLTFISPIPFMKKRDSERRLHAWNLYHEDFLGKSYVRKMACAFGWDWGLIAPTAGIWRPVYLIGMEARISHVKIRQEHGRDGPVKLHCRTRIDGTGQIRHRLSRDGKTVVESAPAAEDSAVLSVPDPALWWPNGMGGQPLYTLETELLDAEGIVLDTRRLQLGLRTCELVREKDEYGESFRFRVNGRDTFMKGGNWIPCDIFPSRTPPETYRDLLESCRDAGMNMIRVWGGGIYEQETFYDLCDELGLLVWQDFMFACSTYPAFDKAFMKNVEAEARDAVRRLHHRACLALWCGNNELEQGLVDWEIKEWTDHSMPPKDYLALFDKLLPEVVAEEDGVKPYWPSSGHTPGENRRNCWDARSGDAHSWSVWFGGQPIESQRTWQFRFMSEFGFQSYPELPTVESFTAPEDRGLVNWIMDYHQRSPSGNEKIFKYALAWFREARGFEASLIVSQLIQALCVQYAAEHARRIQGRMDGLLYWQINDLWPGATWSSIDVHRRWKALHYFARRFFAPVLVSLVEDGSTGMVAIHISNHRSAGISGTVRWLITDCAGKVLTEGRDPVTVASQTNEEIGLIPCMEYREAGGTDKLPLARRHGGDDIPMAGDRNLLVWAVLEENGREISRNLAWFAKPKYWLLEDPRIEATVRRIGKQVVIDLAAKACAPWTRLSLDGHDARFSDNFLHLAPGLPARVTVHSTDCPDADSVRRSLRITPFLDLFR